MTYRFPVVLEWDEETGNWVAYVPALNYLSTFGPTKEETLKRAREAIEGYVEALVKEGQLVPEPPSRVELAEVEVGTG